LYATLAVHSPSGRSAATPFSIDIEETGTILDLIGSLNIPLTDVHLAIVNGHIVHDRSHRLREDDRVGLFPPVGGG
jgi:sulfur carrier protein ThiS